MVTAPARRAAVRELVTGGLSERRALAVLRMSAAALRYAGRPGTRILIEPGKPTQNALSNRSTAGSATSA